jgi:hypothetical protein
MALGSTQRLTEMSTRSISWHLKAAGRRADHLHVPNVLKSGSHKFIEPSGSVQTCTGIALLLPFSSDISSSSSSSKGKVTPLQARCDPEGG